MTQAVWADWRCSDWHCSVSAAAASQFVVVHNTLDADECATLAHALRTLKDELLTCPADPAPQVQGHGPGRGGSFIRPGTADAPQHFLAHLIEADPSITAYATHPRLVAMCEEYIGGEARIVESNCFINRGNEGPDGEPAGPDFAPSWHRGADLPFASHSVNGLTHCNFVKALTNLTELADETDGGTVRAVARTHASSSPTHRMHARSSACSVRVGPSKSHECPGCLI